GYDRVAPEGRAGDRPDAAVLDLAAAGDAARLGRLSGRCRGLAAGAWAARPGLPQPRRAERRGGGRDAAAAGRGRSGRIGGRGLRRSDRRERGGSRRVRGEAGRDAHPLGPARIPRTWTRQLTLGGYSARRSRATRSWSRTAPAAVITSR